MAIDSTIPTMINTLDCIFGLSLMAASPAAPTKPRPIPAPNAARPNAIPAPMSFDEASASEPSASWAEAGTTVWLAAIIMREKIRLARTILICELADVRFCSAFINFRDKMPYLMITTMVQPFGKPIPEHHHPHYFGHYNYCIRTILLHTCFLDFFIEICSIRPILHRLSFVNW